jgi:predicted NACHT family NTPase
MDLVSIISAVVGEKLKSLLANLAREFGDEIQHAISSNILEYQIEEYSRNFCTKTLLHRVQPKALKEFYQPLFISPYPIRSMPQDYNPMARRMARRMAKRMPTDCIAKLFSEQQFITLIGNAGSGKSTVVKYLFLNAIDTQFKIPIKIELRYLNDYDGIVVDFIKDKIFKLNKLAANDKIIERLMGSGDFVFFLDGYDEITSVKGTSKNKRFPVLLRR